MVDNDSFAPMSFDWVPDQDSFLQMAQMVGLIEKDFTDDDVGEFKLYWCGRPEVNKTPYQWHQAFVMNMKRKRTAYGSRNKQVVGSQLATPTAGLDVDDNARDLVKKYGGGLS